MKFKTLRVGDRVRVVGFDPRTPPYRRRLLSMGLTPGTEFTLNRVAPLGDPVQIHVRDVDLCLRRHEADLLILEEV